MDFSLTTLFVVPAGNTVPTVNSTESLVAGKTGVFRNDYSIATAANVTTEPYIYIAQGRQEPFLTGSKRSDKIAKGKVKEYYRVIGGGAAQNQITEITGFKAKCEEEIAVTLRLNSYYIDLAHARGLTRSVVVKAPCCDCGGDPCLELDAASHEAMVDSFVAKINAEVQLKEYVTASKTGVGLAAVLVITGKPVKSDNKSGYQSDLSVNPYHRDRLIFRAYVTKSTDTTADFLSDSLEGCAPQATVTLTQRSTFGPKGTAAEIRQMQEYYHSYQSIHKSLYTDPLWNQTYEDFVDNSKTYDLVYIKFHETDGDDSTFVESSITSTVILAIPNDNANDIIPVLDAYLGTVSTKGNDINANAALAGNTVL